MIFMGLIALSLSLNAAEVPLEKADYVKCMGHVERASQAALLKKSKQGDVDGAMACTDDALQRLSPEQRQQLLYVYKLLAIQIESPSATAHSQLIIEAQRFLGMI